MGQKVNPNGLRLGINKDWQSRWFATKDYAKFLHEDIRIRKVLYEQLSNAGISKIEIERTADEIKVDLFTSKPGVVIGKRGTNINDIRLMIQKEVSKNIQLNIIEVKKPEIIAKLFAEANTTFGKIGVKVWVYLGDVLLDKAEIEEKRKEVRIDSKDKSEV